MVGLFLRSLSTAFHSSCTTSLFLTVATCSFEFTFSCLGMLSNFLHTCWSFIYMPLEKLSFQSGGFLLLSCKSFINIGLLLLIQIMICKYFLPCFAFFPLLLCSLTVWCRPICLCFCCLWLVWHPNYCQDRYYEAFLFSFGNFQILLFCLFVSGTRDWIQDLYTELYVSGPFVWDKVLLRCETA